VEGRIFLFEMESRAVGEWSDRRRSAGQIPDAFKQFLVAGMGVHGGSEGRDMPCNLCAKKRSLLAR